MGAVLASWAAASCWRGHLLTVRCGAALLVLFGCVVGDEGLVLLACLTFVCLVGGGGGGGFLVGVKKALESSTSVSFASGISEITLSPAQCPSARHCRHFTGLGQSAVLCCPFCRQFLQSAAASRRMFFCSRW